MNTLLFGLLVLGHSRNRRASSILACTSIKMQSKCGKPKPCLMHYNTGLAYTKVCVLHATLKTNLVLKKNRSAYQ